MVEEIGGLTNDIFLSLIENDYSRLRQFRGDSRLSTWLFTVSENKAKDFLKKQKVLIDIISLEENDDQELQIPDNRPSVVEQLEKFEIVRAIFTKLQERLSDQEKKFIKLHYFQDQPLSSVADEMDISMNNIYVIKHRVKKKAAEMLSEIITFKKNISRL
jgi:RNA polymerase sigma-70 factor (ECF subfamily)